MIKYDEFLREDRKELFNKIYAHTREGYLPEKLEKHSSLTLKYFNKLMSDFKLNKVIDNLISGVFLDDKQETIRKFIEYIIFCHDIGKINPLFQKKLQNNINIETSMNNSNHSHLGYIIFISLMYNKFRKKIKGKNLVYLIALASIINGHHTKLNNLSTIFKDEDLLKSAHELYAKFFDISKTSNGKVGNKYIYQVIREHLQILESNKDKNSDIERRESFFYLYKLLYSLLIISDYYATLDFKKGISYLDSNFNLLITIKDKIDNFYNNPKHPYNSGLISEEIKDKIHEQNYSEIENINQLRTKILHDANRYIDEIDLNKKRIFYLRLPTGSGKTNISISLAINMFKRINNINRIYYVFPFINIIEQNYKDIKETLQLNENEISEIYCNSEWLEKEESKDEEWKYYLNNEFLNYPINVMSNVNFFNTFIKSGKAQNYKLHNLANSLVIIDEIQSLNDKDWTMFLDFIAFSSRKLNIYYLIMSATLPRLNNLLKEEEKFADSFFANVFPEKIESQIFNHYKFKNRVTLRLRHDIQSKEGIITLLEKNLPQINPVKILVVVNTVQDSLNLYRTINDWNKNKKKFDEVFLLNSTILPFRRKKVIKEIESSDKNILLVSTQSVEAGVNIDCDYGIRDFAIFDSIEQVAGRINRNCNKDISFLDIVLLKENDKERWSVIYGNSERGQVLKECYSEIDQLEEFIEKRNILDFYDKVISVKNDKNNSKIQRNDRDTIKNIRNLEFEKLTEKNVISQSSISFFVSLDLTKDILSEYPDIFSSMEKNILKSLNINLVKGLRTKLLWDHYTNLRDEDKSVTDKKIDLKKFNSLLTKFMFSVSCNRRQLSGSSFNQGLNLLDGDKFTYMIEKGLDVKELMEYISNEAEFW